MSVSKSEAERCLVGLEETIEILLQQNQHRNTHTMCCIIIVLQEYITHLLPLFEPLSSDIECPDKPDLSTSVSVILHIGAGENSGIVLGDLGESLDNRIFLEQIIVGSSAEGNEDIEIDHIVLEINTHPLLRCSLERAALWLDSAERSGTVELLLARSISVEREDTRYRVHRAVDRLSYRLSQEAVRRANGITDLEEISRIVRTLTNSRTDSTDYTASDLKIHIRRGTEDIGIATATNSDTGLVTIVSIRESSAIERDGRICIGDIIVKVNGISVNGLAEDKIMELLNVNRSVIQLVVKHGEKSEGRSVIEYSEKESFDSQKLETQKQTRTEIYENETFQNKPIQAVSPNKPPLPNTNVPIELSGRDITHRTEYTRLSGLSQRSDNSDEYSALGLRNSPMRSSFQVRHVALSRNASTPLGFTIAGGKGSRKGDIGIFIGHIHDRGAASQEGSMKIGDEILEVNGLSLEGMSQRKALQTFKKLKQGLITIKLKSRFIESENLASYEMRNVTLYKTADAGLGLELILLIDADGGYKDGIYIQNVREASVAYQDGSLTRGDQLLTINGDPLTSTNLRKAHAIIGTLAPGSVDIGIRRYTPVAPLERLLTLAKRQNRLQPIPSQLSMRLEPRAPSYQTDASNIFLQEMNKLSSDSSENDSTLESDLTKLIAGIERANSFTLGEEVNRKQVYSIERAHGSETALRMSREELENMDIDALLSPIDTEPVREEIMPNSDSEDSLSALLAEPLLLSSPIQHTSVNTDTSKRDMQRLDIARRGYSRDKMMETVSLNRSMGQTLGDTVIKKREDQLLMEEEFALVNRYIRQQKFDETPIDYTEQELATEDCYIYCEECDDMHFGDCPLFGEFEPLKESEIKTNSPNSIPVPKELSLRISPFPNTGETIPVRTRNHTQKHKPYKCQQCSCSYQNKRTLTRHTRIHTGRNQFACDICNKRFSDASNLTVHTRIHTGDRPFECTSCNKRFNKSCNLTRHVRTHTGEKPYGCLTCKARFSDASSLTRHARAHTGEKPYECLKCKKRFSNASHLTRHVRTQHKVI